jgi:hypothetical protein
VPAGPVEEWHNYKPSADVAERVAEAEAAGVALAVMEDKDGSIGKTMLQEADGTFTDLDAKVAADLAQQFPMEPAPVEIPQPPLGASLTSYDDGTANTKPLANYAPGSDTKN